jgi:PadR family transcriptional regulator PadR
LVKARWVVTANNRRARVYEISPAGRRQLEADEKRWRTVTLAVAQVLERI